MALLDPLVLQNQTYSAGEIRALTESVFREGVVGVSDLIVSERGAGTNMSIDVAAGTCVVAGTDDANQGYYLCRSTATENVTIGAAPGVGTSRYDLIVAQVRDGQVTGGSDDDWLIEVVQGVASSSPTEPATPDSALVLARVTVDSGTAAITDSMIADRRVMARQLAIATSTTRPYGRQGDWLHELDTGRLVMGKSDGTWIDFAARHNAVQAHSLESSFFGGAPALGTSRWKVASGRQTVGILAGGGNLTLPTAFTGISAITITPEALATSAVTVTIRTSGTSSTPSGTNVPVSVWDLTNGPTFEFTGGTIVLHYHVIGW